MLQLSVLRIIYNLLFELSFLLSVPHYFLKMVRRGNWRKDFGQRFARYSQDFRKQVEGREIIWFHAVSVGEVGLCLRLLEQLKDDLKDFTVVASTTTSTGMGELRKRTPEGTLCMYYPIDRWTHVRRALSLLSPRAVILVEAEIWPNILWSLRDRNIPTFLVNARLSDRSRKGYARFGFLFRPLFQAFHGIGAQNEADRDRLVSLGCGPDRVQVTGSMKFDSATLDGPRSVDAARLLAQAGFPEGSRFLVAGSTHDGEEILLARMVRRLRGDFPELRLVVVPRHFERGNDIQSQLEREGIRSVQRSRLKGQGAVSVEDPECFLVDSTGELKWFYEKADLVFVGKSLTAKGGQNPIEPGAFSKPMMFGPNMQNFRDIVADFLANDAAIRVEDEAELEHTIRMLLKDPERCAGLGEKARGVVTRNQGATDRTCIMIRKVLESL